MVTDRLSDGVRIAQLLASEVTGNEGRLRRLTVADADDDVDPTPDGALAYRLARTGDDGGDGTPDEVVAEAFVQPERVRLEFVAGQAAVADAAEAAGLRVRPKAVRPPRTLVFIEDGAAVKRVRPVLERVADRGV